MTAARRLRLLVLLPAVISQALTRTAGTSPFAWGLQLGALLILGTLTSFGVTGLSLVTDVLVAWLIPTREA